MFASFDVFLSGVKLFRLKLSSINDFGDSGFGGIADDVGVCTLCTLFCSGFRPCLGSLFSLSRGGNKDARKIQPYNSSLSSRLLALKCIKII